MHITSEQVTRELDKNGDRAAHELTADDFAWNPASTKPERVIIGPASLVYTRHADGGVTLNVAVPE